MPYLFLFILAAIGIIETLYLIKKRFTNQKPICLVGHNCQTVLSSKYNKTFGMPNDLGGLIFYVSILILTIILFAQLEPLVLWQLSIKVVVTIGVIMSLVFIYIQWRIIRAWCFLCLLSAFTTFAMALVILYM